MDTIYSRNLEFSSQNYKLLKWDRTIVVVVVFRVVCPYTLSISPVGCYVIIKLSEFYPNIIMKWCIIIVWLRAEHNRTTNFPFAHCLWVGSNYQFKLKIWYLVYSLLLSCALFAAFCENIWIEFRLCRMVQFNIDHQSSFFPLPFRLYPFFHSVELLLSISRTNWVLIFLNGITL